MTRRIWMIRNATGTPTVTRCEPASIRIGVRVSVRAANTAFAAPFDGVWLDGERSYDTYVIVDGEVLYHSPAKGVADKSFDGFERDGGGHAVG